MPPLRAGVALKLEYDGVTGSAVVNLTTNAAFPSSPTAYSVLAAGLEEPVDFADNFGAWTRGFIEAPQTGSYTFWIASDDDGELWLSTNYDSAGVVKIAENIGAVGRYSYFGKPAQQSAPIPLVAGEKYYFETLHKEGTGGDHCSVAWMLPDGSFQNVLSGNNLWPFPVNVNDPSYPPISEAPSILSLYLGTPVTGLDPSGTTFANDGRPLDLTVTVEASQPAYVQWYSNGMAIAGANISTYHIPRVTMAMNGTVYSVTVTNNIPPAVSGSTTLSVTPDVTPPTVIDALALGNPTGDVAVVFSEPVDPVSATTLANYSINNGAAINSVVMSADPAAVLLRVGGTVPGTTYTLTVQNVKDLATTPNPISPNPSSLVTDGGLHTWFRMDETAGVSLGDSSGNSRNATLTNGALPGYTGKVLRGVKFDGVAGHVLCQQSADDFSTNGLTVALWANSVSSLQNWARFIDYGVGAFSDNILFARNATSADLTFEVYNGATSGGKVTAPGALALNRWQHLAVTMDAFGNTTIYQDGVAVAAGTTHVPNPVVRTNNFIGRSNMGGLDGYYQGRLDDLRIYTRALDPAAIAALAAGGGPDDTSVPAVSVAVTAGTTALKNTPPGVFTLTRGGSVAAPLTVAYTMSGTATNGTAYTNLSGSVVIPAGTNMAQVYIHPRDLSFTQLEQTAVLTLAGGVDYTIASADSGTVTIQNNDVVPVAVLATADNALAATNATTVDVWFASAVANPSATTLGNYSLAGAPGLTITNATLTANGSLRVVLGVSGRLPAGAQLSVNGVQDAGGNTAAATLPIRQRLAPANVVANVYHGTTGARAVAFGYVTDGIVNNTNNSPTTGNTGFDTWAGAANASSNQFCGMVYGVSQEFQAVKVDLGRQFGDGGDWQAQPKVYILTNPVDTGSIQPGVNPNWVQIPAQLISASSQFQTAGWPNPGPSPNTPYVFSLTNVPAAQRTGFGWAVGGVKGNGGNGFLSFSELRAYGVAGSSNTTFIVQQPQNRTVTKGQRTTFVELSTNVMQLALAYQWQQNGTNIPGATDVNYSIPPATLADNGATFDVVVNTTPGSSLAVTSRLATLQAVDRTTPPNVVAANLDTFNLQIDVWFDEPVDGNTAQLSGNYTLNDPALVVYNAVTNANGYGATLSYAGTPSVSDLAVTVMNVQDLFGQTLTSQTTTVWSQNWPVVNVLANQYQQPRATCLSDSTNGIIIHATGDANVWATFEGTKNPYTTDFVGLQYAQAQVFGVIKVDLGYQFGDGGDWELQPSVFILKNPIDTNQRYPESDPADWVQVPATLVSGNVFNYALDGPAGAPVNTPIAFDLSHLPLSQRTGYGWAVGGAPANQAAHFVSITELRGFGVEAAAFTNFAGAPEVMLDLPESLVQPAGLPLSLTVYATGAQPLSYQWTRNGVNLTDGGLVSGAHSNVLTLAEAFVGDAGTYQLWITNSAGWGQSQPCAVSLTPVQPNNGAAWTQNGVNGNSTWVPVISGNTVTLTDGLVNERSSVFLNYPQYIGSFAASYIYQDVGGGGADGAVFVLQNDPRGAAALGGGGGGLGYSGITPSVGLEFNLYGPNSPSAGSSGIAFRVNGATGTPYTDSSPVNPASGNPIAVLVRYDGVALSVTLSNTVTGGVFSTNYAADMPTLLGTNTAYVGMTGADGGLASTQRISNFVFASTPALGFAAPAPGMLQLWWPASASGLVLQSAPDLQSGAWTPVGKPVSVVNGLNQVQISPLTGAQFYRLNLP